MDYFKDAPDFEFLQQPALKSVNRMRSIEELRKVGERGLESPFKQLLQTATLGKGKTRDLGLGC